MDLRGLALQLKPGSKIGGGGAIFPPGLVFDYAGSGSVPSGFLLCDGSNVSRTTYAALFATLGTTWGVGDGSTTFGLPDTRRRVSVGNGGTGTGTLGNSVGDTGGEEDHTLTAGETAVLTAASDGAHAHSVQFDTDGSGSAGNFLTGGSNNVGADASQNTVSAGAHTHTVNSGGGGSHNTMQPSYVVQKIIKT